jgi:hypothetical protein
MRKPKPKPDPVFIDCEECGQNVKAYRPEYQRYCSATCRFKAWSKEHPRVNVRREEK